MCCSFWATGPDGHTQTDRPYCNTLAEGTRVITTSFLCNSINSAQMWVVPQYTDYSGRRMTFLLLKSIMVNWQYNKRSQFHLWVSHAMLNFQWNTENLTFSWLSYSTSCVNGKYIWICAHKVIYCVVNWTEANEKLGSNYA